MNDRKQNGSLINWMLNGEGDVTFFARKILQPEKIRSLYFRKSFVFGVRIDRDSYFLSTNITNFIRTKLVLFNVK